jgi:hypothetical protein
VASAFLMRQLSQSCLQRAQALALGYHNTTRPLAWEDRLPERVPISQGKSFSGHDEYLRLGVMRLLRDLPDYRALFNYRWKDYEIDCVLQPLSDSVPAILVEFKMRIQTVQQARDALRKLHRVGAGWDKSTLFGLLTINLGQELPQPIGKLVPSRLAARTFLLIYDAERNEFSRQSASQLIHANRCTVEADPGRIDGFR